MRIKTGMHKYFSRRTPEEVFDAEKEKKRISDKLESVVSNAIEILQDPKCILFQSELHKLKSMYHASLDKFPSHNREEWVFFSRGIHAKIQVLDVILLKIRGQTHKDNGVRT